jgi:hypothetical protein
MVGRYPGKDRAVAQGLSKLFGRDDAWGLQVVGASPCVLLHELGAEQAQVISDALIEIENLGCQMEVQEGVDEGLPKVNWPAPARMRGRLVTEMTAPSVPAAGAPMAPAIVNAPTPIHAPPAVQVPQVPQIAAQQAQTATLNLMIPCPYTGQKIKLTLNITVSRAEGQTAMISANAMAAPAQPVSAPMVVPAPASARPPSRANQIPAYHQINTPISTPAIRPPQTKLTPGRPAPVPSAPRGATPSHPAVPVPETNEPIIRGLENLDELLPSAPPPQRTAPPPQRQSPGGPRGGQVRPTSNAALSVPREVVPLPDVPVIHGPNGQNAGPAVPIPAPMPQDPLGAPMDLEQFEAKVSASGIMKAVPAADAQQVFGDEGGGDAPLEDNAVCSVFMGKNNNPRVHQLVAELHGISVAEASRYCQKPIVALAKEISAGDAQELRQKFSAVNVTVRITKKK